MIRATLLLAIAAAPIIAQERITFTTSQKAEVIAELDLSSPLSDWAVRGREAAVAVIRVDDAVPLIASPLTGAEWSLATPAFRRTDRSYQSTLYPSQPTGPAPFPSLCAPGFSFAGRI